MGSRAKWNQSYKWSIVHTAASNTGEANEIRTPTAAITPTKLVKREALEAKAPYYLYYALSLAEFNFSNQLS